MTIVHIVLFKFKESATEQQINQVFTELVALKEKLPHLITSASAGKNFTNRSKGFTHGYVIELPSKQALQEYAVHEDHVKIINTLIAPIKDDVMAVDYEK